MIALHAQQVSLLRGSLQAHGQLARTGGKAPGAGARARHPKKEIVTAGDDSGVLQHGWEMFSNFQDFSILETSTSTPHSQNVIE